MEPDAAIIDSVMELWGMPQSMRDEAIRWYHELTHNSYFAKGLMVPWCMPARPGGAVVPGVLLAMSTPQSASVFNDSCRANRIHGTPITNPEWMYYHVYWYPHLALMNIAGLSEAQYDPQELTENLGVVLDRMARLAGITNFQGRYCMTTHGMYHDGLRMCLRDVGILNWVEATSGISYHGYRCLDVYLKIYSHGMAAPKYEAHWLLNTEWSVQYRRYLAPEQWYLCKNWVSKGQKESITEHLLEDVRMRNAIQLQASARGMGHRANLRVGMIISHLRPPEAGIYGKGMGNDPGSSSRPPAASINDKGMGKGGDPGSSSRPPAASINDKGMGKGGPDGRQ
jgi:hypothetical protein